MKRVLEDALIFLARMPRASAAVALVSVLAMGCLVRVPVIDGTMVGQMSDSSQGVLIEQRVAAARGHVSSVVVIVTPRAADIAWAFDDLALLHNSLAALDAEIVMNSITAVRDQLFLFGLALDRPLSELLGALREDDQSRALISNDGRQFLVVITGPDSLEATVLDIVSAHDWSRVFDDYAVLAASQLEQDIVSALRQDLRLLIPAIVVVMLLALFLAFGHWRAMLLPVFASCAASVVIFALFSLAGVSINLVTSLALPIVLIVVLANSCHFLAKSKAAVRERADVGGAVSAALLRVGPPFLLSTLTTSIALASLALSDLPPIANLGVLSAAALLILFIVVLLATPYLLRFYVSGPATSLQSTWAYTSASRSLAGSRRRIGLALVLLGVAGGTAIPFLTVNSDPRVFFPDNAPFSESLEAFERDFYVFSPLRVLVTPIDGHVGALAVLQQASALRAALADAAGVRRAFLEPAANAANAFLVTALPVSVDDLWGLGELVDARRPSLASTVDVEYTSAAMVYAEIDSAAMGSMMRSLSWSVVLIFGVVVFAFRSPRALVCSLLANAIPLLLICGVAWLVGDPLNLVTLFVFLVVLGVIVDDSIHILYWEASGDSLSGSSIEFSIVLSTAMLCLGLLLCQLSDFPTTRQFASYFALALVAAVISDLTLLPYTLRWRRNRID